MHPPSGSHAVISAVLCLDPWQPLWQWDANGNLCTYLRPGYLAISVEQLCTRLHSQSYLLLLNAPTYLTRLLERAMLLIIDYLCYLFLGLS